MEYHRDQTPPKDVEKEGGVQHVEEDVQRMDVQRVDDGGNIPRVEGGLTDPLNQPRRMMEEAGVQAQPRMEEALGGSQPRMVDDGTRPIMEEEGAAQQLQRMEEGASGALNLHRI